MKLNEMLKSKLGHDGSDGSDGDGADAEPDPADAADDTGREHTDAMFDALKNDDRDAFHEAFMNGVQSCMGDEGEAEPPKKNGLAILLGGK